MLRWHHYQAHQRALQAWAADPRRDAFMPSSGKISYIPENFDADVDVRAKLWLEPFMLHPDWDVPAHPPTWLVECVDGPVAGAMHTIPWPDDENLPPSVMLKTDPAGGPQLTYYLRDTDLINGIARYTSMQAIKNARIYEVTVRPEAMNLHPGSWPPGRIPSITCPQCGRTSHHIDDVQNGYCANCHQFHDAPMTWEAVPPIFRNPGTGTVSMYADTDAFDVERGEQR